MSLHIAVDIGGTHLRAATYLHNSQTPLQLTRIATKNAQDTPLERVDELITSVWPQGEVVASIGVAAPGPVDPYDGIILQAPNIPGWEDLHLRQHLEERFGVPVALGNDANLAAMGEWKYGAGKGHHHLIYLTVSTGIGGGIIVDDRLLLGVRGLAGEVGHITVLRDGPLCGCGQRGHLEAVASGTAIIRWVQEELAQGTPTILRADQPLNGKLISLAAQQGDELARAALSRAGVFIGTAVADFLHIFNPSAIIIGGGVSQSGKFLLDPLSAAMKEHAIHPRYYAGLVVATAALGDEPGLMGALALARSLKPE